jgi:hypothetical protein
LLFDLNQNGGGGRCEPGKDVRQKGIDPDQTLILINMGSKTADRLIGLLTIPARAMSVFGKLRELRAFQRRQLPFLLSIEDFDVVAEIGYHQDQGHPLTLKLLFLENLGSVATVQRRLSRLKRLGVVHHQRSSRDKRNLELTVSPEVRRVYKSMGKLLSAEARLARVPIVSTRRLQQRPQV